MNSKCITGVIALSLGLAGGLSAQTRSNTDTYGDKARAALNHSDRDFVGDAAKAGMEEVAISQIALTKTTNPQVKEFAQMMVDEHSAANKTLSALALAKGLKLPAAPEVDRWVKKSAQEFDKDYMEKMVEDHQEAVKRFEKQSKNGSDPELTSFAAQTLPKLQHHLARAKELKAAVKR
jgi:putative membrane protein